MSRFFCALLLVMASQSVAANAPDADDIAIEHLWIPMPDGVRLAAELFSPPGAAPGDRLPVLLEYLPYRKDESRERNASLYSAFIRRGYRVARVDIRGTGASEGQLIPYEYSDIELDDGEVVIDWLSRQPFCSGAIGIFGISWGGFNAIQLALRAPPALKAFVAVMATEDLYQDDVHYMDGIFHMDSWMMSQDLYNALPAAPDYVIDDDWVRQRFDTEPSFFTYLRQQRDGPFWDRASTREERDRVRVPGFHIGGWYDGYRDSVPRMVAASPVPARGLVGPWDHFFPHDAWPGESMEWRVDAARWFDHWLKGEDTGMLEEPRLALFLRDWHPPGPELDAVPGQWRWYDSWPPKGARQQTWFATPGGDLEHEPGEPAQLSLAYKASNGVEGGGPVMWWGSVAPDQQPTDDHSLVFDSGPLDQPVAIIGFPRALLRVSADTTRANWVARLSDVAPDGRVTQVAGAAFNGSHRESARDPADWIPGVLTPLAIELHFTSWVFPAGHRIRLAVNNGQWPMLWPTPYPFTSQWQVGGPDGLRLELPLAPPDDGRRPPMHPPERGPSLAGFEVLDAGNVTGYGEVRDVHRDPATGDAVVVAQNSGGERFPWGVQRFEEWIEHRTNDQDPARSSMRGRYALEIELTDRTLRLETDIEVRSDRQQFHARFARRFLVDGEQRLERTWREVVPRDHQ